MIWIIWSVYNHNRQQIYSQEVVVNSNKTETGDTALQESHAVIQNIFFRLIFHAIFVFTYYDCILSVPFLIFFLDCIIYTVRNIWILRWICELNMSMYIYMYLYICICICIFTCRCIWCTYTYVIMFYMYECECIYVFITKVGAQQK